MTQYNEDEIRVLGTLKCKLEFQGQTFLCDLVVVPSGKRSILGRNALAGLGIRINCSNRTCEIIELRSGVQERFKEVFSDKLGKVEGFIHRVKQKKVIKPVQHKVRRLPVSLR